MKHAANFDNKIFVINKSRGRTSFRVVEAFREATRLKKVGHTGTLDPLAEGVLILCTGRATRAAEYFMDLSKTYMFDVFLGAETTTLDGEGEIVREVECEPFEKSEIARALTALTGTYMQDPPIFSALKQNGRRLYDLARNGESVSVTKRRITIYKFDILGVEHPVIRLQVECSRGTYVRSLAKDLGNELGVPAHVSRLVRTKIGPFVLDKSCPDVHIFMKVLEKLDGLELGRALDFLPAAVITAVAEVALLNGIAPEEKDVVREIGLRPTGRPVRILSEDDRLLAVGCKKADSLEPSRIIDGFRLFVEAKGQR
jgi:tRNA pseudouridine55 synthase